MLTLTQQVLSPGFWFQPIFYAFHGWIATEMAIWMLFRPHHPKFIPGTKLQLPFTPGIFPRGRHKLSIAIAHTITEMLLTTEDIKKQAEKLVTEENIFKTLDVLLDSVSKQLRDVGNLRRIYQTLDRVVPEFLERLALDTIEKIESGDAAFLQTLSHHFMIQVFPRLQVNPKQAEWLIDQLFGTILTADQLRLGAIEMLSEENIDGLDNALKDNIKGLQGFLLRFIDTRGALLQLRTFLLSQPEKANQLILKLIDELAIREKIAEQLSRYQPRSVPPETLAILERTLAHFLQSVVCDHREALVQAANSLSHSATRLVTNQLLQMDPQVLMNQWLPGLKRDLAHFTYKYLDEELENMLSLALPAISLNTLIIEKIDRFSAKELEQTIQRICHRELRYLAFLGAFLGFWLGLVSNLMSHWLNPCP